MKKKKSCQHAEFLKNLFKALQQIKNIYTRHAWCQGMCLNKTLKSMKKNKKGMQIEKQFGLEMSDNIMSIV